MRYHVEALLNIDCKTYFVERDAASFRSLLAKTLSLGEYEFVEAWSEGPIKFVKLKTKPDFSAWVPKSAAGALPLIDLEFFDIITYDPAELEQPPYRLHVRSEIPGLTEKTNIHSTLTIEEAGPDRTRQVLEGEIKVKVFGLGGLAERMVKSSLERTYKRLPEVVERWVEFRQDVLRQPGGNQRLLLGRPSLSSIPWISQEVKKRLQTSQERPSQKRSLQDSRLPSFGSARRKRSQQSQPGLEGSASGSQTTGQARRKDGPQTSAGDATHRQETQQAEQAAQQMPARSQDQEPVSQTPAEAATEQPCTVGGSGGTSRVHLKGAGAGVQGSAVKASEAQQSQQEQLEAHEPVAAGLPSNPCETARVTEPSAPAGEGGTQASPFAKTAAEGVKEPRMVAADASWQGAPHTDGSWSSFNADSQDWGRYWSQMGVQPIPGAGFISPGLIRLGSFSYRVGLLRPVVILAGGGTVTRAAWTRTAGIAGTAGKDGGSWQEVRAPAPAAGAAAVPTAGVAAQASTHGRYNQSSGGHSGANAGRGELSVLTPAERDVDGAELRGPSTPAQLQQESVGRWGGSMGGSSTAGRDLGSSQAYGSSRDGSVVAVRGGSSSVSAGDALSDATGRWGGSSAGGGRQHLGSSQQAYESSRDGSMVAARGSVTSPGAVSEEDEEDDGASVAASASTAPSPGLAVVPYQQAQQGSKGGDKQRQRLSGSTSKRLLRRLLCAA